MLGGCAHDHAGKRADRAMRRAAAASALGWRGVITAADRDRLRDWRQTWTAALTNATAAGAATRIAAGGALLQPDTAIAHAAPPPGDYRCRVVKIGTRTPGGDAFTAYPPFACRISAEGALLRLTKLDGSQRPTGLLYPQDDGRMVFLGTMVLGDETMALHYGRDAERDMVGAFERIGDRRWRLVLPAPRWESLLDVMELVPA